MLCDWTEKVSLLVDGELSRAEAAAVEAHLGGCDDCRAARGAFLAFRRQLGSYRADVNPAAQRRALETILASGRRAAPRRTTEFAGATRAGRREKVLAALGLSPVGPRAAAAALALILAAAAGLVLYLDERDEAHSVVQAPAAETGGAQATTGPEVSGNANTAAGPAAPRDDEDEGGRPRLAEERVREVRRGGHAPADARAERQKGTRRARGEHSSPAVAANVRPPRGSTRPAPRPPGVNDDDETASVPAGSRSVRRELPRAGLDTARHVEQAQMLLRSFRNARATDDLVHERERSRRLLYRNIVLRREAASNGDPVVASVLGRLEPILIDIANLPESPAPGDVDPIRERVRKKNLVVVLQAGVGKYSSRQ